VPIAGRRLASEMPVGDQVLPPGTDVTPAIWLTHTREATYPEPYAFRPERFLDSAPSTYAWVPFGGGVRRCLGAAFAEMEMRVVLTEILRRLTVEAAPGTSAERIARRNVTFSPAHGTRLVARVRVPERRPLAQSTA
jgi:cytochrome P450 family 135